MVDDEIEFGETPSEEDLDKCYGGRYLGAAEVGDKKIRTRIVKVRKETMQQQGGKQRPKLVVYCANVDRGLVLNVTNKNALVDALGRKPEAWKGAEIGIYSIDTQFGTKMTKGVRIKVLSTPKSSTATVTQMPQPSPKPSSTAETPPPDEPGDPGFQGDDEVDFGTAAE